MLYILLFVLSAIQIFILKINILIFFFLYTKSFNNLKLSANLVPYNTVLQNYCMWFNSDLIVLPEI